MVRIWRFERQAYALGERRSIQLSYIRIYQYFTTKGRLLLRKFDLLFRRRMLYPTELLGHIMILTQFCKINDCFYMVFFKHLLIVWIY